MPLTLPEPSREILPRAQLDLVVCQVKHERNPLSTDPKRVLAVQERLDGQYPTIEDVAAHELNLTVGAMPSSETSRGWRLRSEDQDWTAVIMPDFFALETTEYTDWAKFKSNLEAFSSAVEGELGPSIETRLGLRYIDRLTKPVVKTAAGWKQFIQPELLGPVLHEALGGGVQLTQQIVQLDGGNGCRVLLRHGCFLTEEDGERWTYLLDHDCSRARSSQFATAAILDGVEDLHTLALQVFQASITPDLMRYLQGDDVA